MILHNQYNNLVLNADFFEDRLIFLHELCGLSQEQLDVIIDNLSDSLKDKYMQSIEWIFENLYPMDADSDMYSYNENLYKLFVKNHTFRFLRDNFDEVKKELEAKTK